MKIQEMKSGILHLNKKMGNEGRENFFETRSAAEAMVEQAADPGLPLAADNELDQPRWSVISFDQREAGALSYKQASALMTELASHGVAGLCIVTDEAAARITT
jgi:hypothetical protein